MKCNTEIKTIKQYKCLQHLEKWGLSLSSMKVEMIDTDTVKVTDRKGDSMIIHIDEKGIIFEDGIPANVAHA